MAPNVTLKYDTKAFRKALIEYTAASGKTMPEVANRTCKNWAFRSVRYLPKGQRASIVAIGNKSWWPKYIATLLRFSGTYDPDEARAVSKRILGSRLRSITFMRSALVKSASAFGETKARAKSSLTMSRGRANKATVTKPNAEFTSTWLTKRGTKDKLAKEAIGVEGLRRGLAFVTADMQKYTTRKLSELGRKHSAKRR